MNLHWSDSVTQSVGSTRLTNVSKFLEEVEEAEFVSPIDRFYCIVSDIVRSFDERFTQMHPTAGPLGVVGLVSATENYFRDVFSGVIRICPKSRELCANQSVNFGSMLWHKGGNLERGAFENKTFLGSSSIKDVSRKFVGFEIGNQSEVSSVLSEYDKVCEIRHAIVHSSSFLAGRNAIKLNLSSNTSQSYKVSLGFQELQECADVCYTLATSFNKDLFAVMAERWAHLWPTMDGWNPDHRNKYFYDLWDVFYSRIDGAYGNISNPISKVKCKNEIEKDFGLR